MGLFLPKMGTGRAAEVVISPLVFKLLLRDSSYYKLIRHTCGRGIPNHCRRSSICKDSSNEFKIFCWPNHAFLYPMYARRLLLKNWAQLDYKERNIHHLILSTMTPGERISPLLPLLYHLTCMCIYKSTGRPQRSSSHIHFSLRPFLATDIIKTIRSSVLHKTIIRSIRKSADWQSLLHIHIFTFREKIESEGFFSVVITYFFFPKHGSVSNACTLWWFLAATKPDIHIKITLIVSLWKEGKL